MATRAALNPTDRQFGSVGNLGRDAAAEIAKKLGMTRDQVQQLWLGRGGEVKAGFREVLRKYGLPVNPYEDEWTKQAWFYPEGFTVPTLEVQAKRLQKVLGFEPKWWPEEAQNMSFSTGEFGADGIGLWPILPELGRIWDIADPRGAGYGKMIATVCGKINKSKDMAPLVNYRDGQLDERYVRIHAEVMSKLVPLEEAAERQECNCLAMPINFGDWNTGYCYSPRNARWQCINLPPNRLAIEPVAGLSLLVGVSERLTAYEQLFLDFTGAEYNWSADGSWSRSLCASFGGGQFEFDAYEAYYADGRCGAFVGFPGVSELAA